MTIIGEGFMKRRILGGLLLIEAAVCVAVQLFHVPMDGGLFLALAFPFDAIGQMLRACSLSGATGNAVAMALYALIGLAPICVLLRLIKKRQAHAEDALLVLLSAALFGILYLMINPGLISALFGGFSTIPGGVMDASAEPFVKALLGGSVYSVLLTYLVLKVLRRFFVGSRDKLQQYLSVLLWLVSFLFVFLAFGPRLGALLGSIRTMQAGNTGRLELLNPSYAFLGVQFALEVLPYLLNVCVAFSALRLLDALRLKRYSDEVVALAQRLSRLCLGALAVTLVSNMLFNLAQFAFAKALVVINGTILMPIFSVAFVLVTLLMSQFVAENKSLKDDNDQFI